MALSDTQIQLLQKLKKIDDDKDLIGFIMLAAHIGESENKLLSFLVSIQ